MKKTIIIEILLSLILTVLLTYGIFYLQAAIEAIRLHGIWAPLMHGIFILTAAILDLVVMFLVATSHLPKLRLALENHKKRKVARKEEKKQKRIEFLQAELDALKKDE